ncbi:MAG: hypothetical protein GY810_14595 [Aureispira sp.]|nr:hypothetical protein [Aureispira sp.]
MTAEEYIVQYKMNPSIIETEEFIQQILFKHNGKTGWGERYDLNEDFREEVIEELYKDYTNIDKPFVLKLWAAEQEHCSDLTTLTDCFRLITFMLYTLATVEDIPHLIDAKLHTSFDASCGLDINLMFPVDYKTAKEYYIQNPYSGYDIIAILDEYNEYELTHKADYTKSWKEYFDE